MLVFFPNRETSVAARSAADHGVDGHGHGVDKDGWNAVSFKPVTTTGLRLEAGLQKEWSAGIQEWKLR